MKPATITLISSDGTTIQAPIQEGWTVIQAIRNIDPALIDAPCGGAGTCGKCRISMVSGDGGPIAQEERRHVSAEDLRQGIRLACRVKAREGLTVALGKRTGSAVIRESFSQLSGTPDPLHTEKGLYGVAVDIGTTTVAAYLIDFSLASVVATASCLNRQRTFGVDVIARIDYAGRGPQELHQLADLIRQDISQLTEILLKKANLRNDSIREFSVVGNTTMLHLFAAVDPSSIAVAPFTPVFTELRSGKAEDYGLAYPKARITLGPSIAGYVGADIAAGIRAVGMEKMAGLTLLLDLGTNGEMALGNRDAILTCATAAGPAFEGAAISQGMGGVIGAIDSVYWEGDKLRWTTIGGQKPLGICGSGIIDTAACLVQRGIADESGALSEPYDQEGFPVAPGDKGPIRFTQGDIRQIQLAKGAVAAGIATLLQEKGASVGDIDTVFLAGGFGSYLRPESAAAIGLFPRELLSKVEAVGNAAGHGAVRMILFKKEAEELQSLAQRAVYIELSTSAFFRDQFIEEMFFPADQNS